MNLGAELNHLDSLDAAIRAVATECAGLSLGPETTEAIATLTKSAAGRRISLAKKILAEPDAPEARAAARTLLNGVDAATAAELRRQGRLQ